MASHDLIAMSFKQQWLNSGFAFLCPFDNIYFGRSTQPSGLVGFPYMEMFIKQTNFEVVTVIGLNTSIAKYDFQIDVWTCQNQEGGETSGDAVIDQGVLMRAVATTLHLPPNTGWLYLPQFMHSLPKANAEPRKDRELYEGRDVWKSEQHYEILCRE